MNFIVVGTNHKYSPITLRERLSFSKSRLKPALEFLKEKPGLSAAAIVSTCNRVEIYASTQDLKTAEAQIQDFICRYHEIEPQRVGPFLYIHQDRDALKHLFSVASGLDSLILGERQIMGQIRSCLVEAAGANFVDKFLQQIFEAALSSAGRVHRVSKISEGKVSLGSLAVDFIKERLRTLQGKNILIIGVGKVSRLVLQYLNQESPRIIFISNRSWEKAQDLARQIGAQALRLDSLRQFLIKADVLITTTASPHFIIKKETLKEAFRASSHKLLIIDLALPRDVDPRVKEINNVELFCLEDLESVIRKNVEKRHQEAKRVKQIIDREANQLWSELTRLEPEPAPWP